MWIYINLPTVVEGLATTLRCWRGRYYFPKIALLTLDLYRIIPSVKQGWHQVPYFESLVWLDLKLNPGPRAIKSTFMPIAIYSACSRTRFRKHPQYIYIYIYIYIYMLVKSPVFSCSDYRIHCGWINGIYHHHHHHIVLAARISLTLSRHSSLSFIALGRSSGQHPVSSHSCWMYVRAGRPAFARSCVGIHKSTSLMSSSLLLQQCPACLVRLT